MSRRLERISGIADRFDEVPSELKPQPAYIDVDHITSGVEGKPPNLGEQLLTTEDFPLGCHEVTQQHELSFGEMDFAELRDTTMDPSLRSLLQINVEQAALADEVCSILMGDDVELRRHFIQTNAKDVRFLDI